MKKWNSAFTSLAISYVSIVLVIVLSLCSVFYVLFSSHYKEELRSRNQLILNNTAGTIEASVLQRIQQIYLEVSLHQTAALRLLTEDALGTSLSRISQLQDMLKAQVASNPDVVQAVHLYAPRQQVMLSSLYGLKYNVHQGESAAVWDNWTLRMAQNPRSSLWTEARWVPEDIVSSVPGGSGNRLITYAHSYPFQASGADSDLVIAIDVKESAINAIIGNMLPAEYQSSFIVDPSGTIIAGMAGREQETAVQAAPFASSIKDVLSGPAAAGSFGEKIEGTSYMISYEALPSTGWTLFSAAPADLFYANWMLIRNLIVAVCLLVLLLGLGMSGVLAKVSYRPLKRVVGRIKDLSGTASGQALNEFRLIDSAFDQLSDKVSNLEESLQASSPILKQRAVLNLLQGIYTREELADKLQCLGELPEYGYYCCLLIHSRAASAQLSPADIQRMMHGIIDQLERLPLPGSRIIAAELPDKRVAAIICAGEASATLPEQLAHRVAAEGRRQLGLEVQLARGGWVQELTALHLSYSEAQTLLKYAYFLPEVPLLQDPQLLERENSAEELPQSVLVKFKEKLQARQLDELVAAALQLTAALQEGRYSADYCHFVLANTVFIYSDYLKSIRYKPSIGGHTDLYNEYIALPNIRHVQEWLVASLTTFITGTEKRNSDRALSTIETAKLYIERDLAGDLSLDAVSTQVFISPKYLSKLFKEELGVTYTDYVTGRRMERARLLIEGNKMTVDQIAAAVGYGTTAYFIKRFKELYGCTPGNYLRTVHEAQPLQA
ncbi:AraC family transcriptional regulator [Paenibacillus tepidiphilus]|uniref:AraC family transcriptional regulator n=1 Tax=Paenibacillus tepidiphilus TaxID=2608683 RepID=UPI001239588A|nr:AraC family transcriptional regulator [Paenibacillus tepidiphilus]